MLSKEDLDVVFDEFPGVEEIIKEPLVARSIQRQRAALTAEDIGVTDDMIGTPSPSTHVSMTSSPNSNMTSSPNSNNLSAGPPKEETRTVPLENLPGSVRVVFEDEVTIGLSVGSCSEYPNATTLKKIVPAGPAEAFGVLDVGSMFLREVQDHPVESYAAAVAVIGADDRPRQSKIRIFVFKTRNCVSKTRNCVSKMRNFVLKMMNFAVALTFDLTDPTAAETQPDSSVITILCPEGSQEGEMIAITLPDGRDMEVTIPEGMEPGDELEIEIEISTEEAMGVEEAEDEEEEEGSIMLVTILCPAGLGPGGSTLIGLPDGRELEVIIPDGVEPGDEFEVEVDAAPSPGPAESQPDEQAITAEQEAAEVQAVAAVAAEVRFQWKNPDFLLKNPDFLFRNPDFLLTKMLIL